MVYNRRLLFVLKLAANLEKLDESRQEEAFRQYPEDVVQEVRRTLLVRKKFKRSPSNDGQG